MAYMYIRPAYTCANQVCETRKHNKKQVAGIHSLNGAMNTQQSFVGVGQRMTWTDARAYCRSQYPGGDLASIHSAASNAYVRQLCNQQLMALGGIQDGHSSCWVGANDKDTEGTEVWSDGTEIVRLTHTLRYCLQLCQQSY